ncbi:ribonuclease E [Leucobacter luti]|uniref:Ribonuclease E n=1 Tax=Leucobacter luti TaxID=340320 RepID=A0A4R6RZK7_9MICO|nr:Rne/Rng family ribonuclease [Leucobacter luti]TDP92632.1 ribonuclease E [Leucobacter luti]
MVKQTTSEPNEEPQRDAGSEAPEEVGAGIAPATQADETPTELTDVVPDAAADSDDATADAGDADVEAPADVTPDAADSSAGPESPQASAHPQLVLPLADMSPQERFRATTRLIFLAPDVPPVPPRPRRSELRPSELRQLDDILDQHMQPEVEQEEREQRSENRRTRRRSGGSEQQHSEDEAPRRPLRQAPLITEPQKVKGSTRLEAKKQRRRDGRDAGRRRMVITESEFLARRESVDREMIVRTTADRVQIGVLEDKVLVEHYVARSSESSLIGNVYLGRVQNVLPSMEAAFVDIGRGRNAVLYSGEVDWSEFEGGNTARKIENALKPGDQILVQVTKDPVGHKGARLTSQISLPGRFLVYVPGGAMNGISRKLPDTERARLKKILKEVLPTGAGVIVRTAAEGATEDQLTHDVQRLTRQWESIQKRVAKGGGPVLLHSEPDMLIKIVRDVFNEDFQRLLISGEDTYTVIENYLSQVAPDLLPRVERFTGERDVFDEYRVTEQIAKALDRKVWLPSGGSLVIDRTEAMTVVDVNTGKFVGSGGNLEETVTKNNLEAAEEIVRQLRLRDIGGIIVVDFIDMVLESNRDLVLRRMVECLSRDRTKHQVAEVTSLGLVQMTRKKLGLGLLESFSEPCDVCAGRGVIVHHEPVTKHRSEAPVRSSKRSGRNGQQQHQQTPQPQQHHQDAKTAAQTHAISDGAKNMLAQVAASTIPASKHEEDSERHVSEPEQPAQQQRGQRATGRVPARSARNVEAEHDAGSSFTAPVQHAQPASGGNLLDSVLNALPDAPSAGTGRARNRRVSTAPLRTGNDARPDDAQAAQLALAEALEATVRRKEHEEE